MEKLALLALAFVAFGFLLGMLAGLKIGELLLAQLHRDIRELEQRLNPPEQRELRVASVDGELVDAS